jgi:hypothetical protein
MSQSTSVATISTPQTQQITTQPTRTLADKIWGGSSKPAEQQQQPPAKRAATPRELATYRETIAAAEAKDLAELTAQVKPEHVQMAQRMFATFADPKERQWVEEMGIRHNKWAHSLLAKAWMHLSAVEKERDALRQEVARLRPQKWKL